MCRHIGGPTSTRPSFRKKQRKGQGTPRRKDDVKSWAGLLDWSVSSGDGEAGLVPPRCRSVRAQHGTEVLD